MQGCKFMTALLTDTRLKELKGKDKKKGVQNSLLVSTVALPGPPVGFLSLSDEELCPFLKVATDKTAHFAPFPL